MDKLLYSDKYEERNELTKVLLERCSLCHTSLKYDNEFMMECGHYCHIHCYRFLYNLNKDIKKYCSLCSDDEICRLM